MYTSLKRGVNIRTGRSESRERGTLTGYRMRPTRFVDRSIRAKTFLVRASLRRLLQRVELVCPFRAKGLWAAWSEGVALGYVGAGLWAEVEMRDKCGTGAELDAANDLPTGSRRYGRLEVCATAGQISRD